MLRRTDNYIKPQQQTSVPSSITQQQSFRMDTGRERQQDRLAHPDLWLSHCDTEAENKIVDGRSGNSSINVVDHHIYAAVPARIRAASSDDRSVGSLVSLQSESSATTESHSAHPRAQIQGQEGCNRQSNVLASRKQSIDDSVSSDTRTLCDQDLTNISPETITSTSVMISSSLTDDQNSVPTVATATSCSPPCTSSFNDGSAPGQDHVVPEPVLNRIRKDCELKEEFLKRPNLPNYLAPPPPTSLSLLNDRLGNNNSDAPVLPPLASPEIDIFSSPVNKTSSASAEHDTTVTSNVKTQPPPYYSPPSHKNSRTTGFARSHARKDDIFRADTGLPSTLGNAQSNLTPNNGDLSRYEDLDDIRGKEFTIAGVHPGEFISTFFAIYQFDDSSKRK